jgi:DNA-directed RNA polymerase subunit RPC12/RpoP
MTPTCDYCNGPIAEGAMHCINCGAPFVSKDAALPDFRFCPLCRRRLLALGSPACSYCGQRLPDAYIKARDGDLKRLTQVSEGEDKSEVGRKVSELIRQTIRSKPARSAWSLGPIDIAGLIDLFR